MIIFLLFKSKEHANKFLEYLKRTRIIISFTAEHEFNDQLPFLDILFTRTNDGLAIDVYRKDTYTGLGLNYYSFILELFEINSIKVTLLHRTYNICSNYHRFHIELEKLRTFLKQYIV